MQCAIDNAKRRYDIDLVKSIRDIKKDMNINKNGYPMFWLLIRRDFNKEKINYSLACPMNSLSGVRSSSKSEKTATIPFGDLFIKHEIGGSRKGCKAIEEMIEKYSSSLFEFNCDDCDDEGYMILAERFEELISDIQKTRIAKSNMNGMMSYLLNRCFKIGAGAKSKKGKMDSILDKNKALLMKTLYSVDKISFLECFEKQKGTTI